jgi:hypothetical protein
MKLDFKVIIRFAAYWCCSPQIPIYIPHSQPPYTCPLLYAPCLLTTSLCGGSPGIGRRMFMKYKILCTKVFFFSFLLKNGCRVPGHVRKARSAKRHKVRPGGYHRDANGSYPPQRLHTNANTCVHLIYPGSFHPVTSTMMCIFIKVKLRQAGSRSFSQLASINRLDQMIIISLIFIKSLASMRS